MKRFIGVFLSLVAFVAVTSVANAQVSVSIGVGRTQSSISSGFRRYLVGGNEIGAKPNPFSSGVTVGARVGYNFGRFIRAEVRASHTSGLRGGSAGLFTIEDLNCVLGMVISGTVCDPPDLSTRLLTNDASFALIGRIPVRRAEIYFGGGPALRQSVLRTRGTRMTDLNFGASWVVGLSRPIVGPVTAFAEYGWTRTGNARFNTERTGSIFVEKLGARTSDQGLVMGISLRL